MSIATDSSTEQLIAKLYTIEGKAEIVIDKQSTILESGQGIIIPAHSPNFIKPNGRFKMILTIIKSGYE